MNLAIKFQRLEGMAILIAAVTVYPTYSGNWWLFAGLLFSVDLTMVGYLVNKAAGAWIYNLGHSLILPLGLLLVGLYSDHFLAALALIWLAHIGLDRTLGYGLKFKSGFGDTHLGTIGRR